MTEEDIINKIEWANKRSSLKGQPFTETQINYLKFVFADKLNKNNCDLCSVVNRRELLLDFADYSERDKTSETTDECVDNYLDSIK